MTLCDAPNGRGGAWSADGTIIFGPNTGPDVRLMRVSAAGGRAEPLTPRKETESRQTNQRWPQILPGGRAVLYISSASPGNYADADVEVQPLASGDARVLVRRAYYPRYLASGHLTYVQDNTLFAVRFDPVRVAVTSDPVPVIEHLRSNPISGGAQFAMSETGSAAFLVGDDANGNSRRSSGSIARGRCRRCVRRAPRG